MTFLLDTNTCIGYLNKTKPSIINKFSQLSPEDIALCDIVRYELYYGAYKSSRTLQNLKRVEQFFQEFISFPFDSQAAIVCGQIRVDLAKKGTPIGVYDLQIAAIALANNLTLVTHNVSEFSRIEGLVMEDWEI